jgi:type IV secretion system protein VirB10
MQTNNNAFNEQWQSATHPEQDAEHNKFSQGIPPLGVDTSRAVNKKGLVFIGLVGLMGAAAVYWMMSSASQQRAVEKSKAVKEEVVVIPERKAPVLTPKPVAAAAPVPLAGDGKTGEPSKDAKDLKVDSLEQRRALDALLVQPNDKGKFAEPIAVVDESKTLIQRRSSEGGGVAIATGGSSAASVYASASAGMGADDKDKVSGKSGANGGAIGGSHSGTSGGSSGGTSDNASVASAFAFPVQGARHIPLSPDFSILQGSALRCLMNTRLISDIPGQVICTITESILSTSAKKILIPKGTKAVGEYSGKASESLERVGIIWNRLITPDNIDIALMSPGTDPLGSAGVPGYVDEKWRMRLGAAVLITLASDILKVGAQIYGPRTTVRSVDAQTGRVSYEELPFDSATVKMIEKAPQPFLNRVLNAPPTILVQQGTLVSIQTAKDMDFSNVYENK